MTKYNELVQYVNENNKDAGKRCQVVTNRDKQFGSWIKYQRAAYRKKIKAMTNERITLLEKIETWSWGKKPTNNNNNNNGYHNNSGNSSSNSNTSSDVSRKGSSNNQGLH